MKITVQLTEAELYHTEIDEERRKGIFLVNVNVKSLDGKATNQRFLDEVYPLDYREGATS